MIFSEFLRLFYKYLWIYKLDIVKKIHNRRKIVKWYKYIIQFRTMVRAFIYLFFIFMIFLTF